MSDTDLLREAAAKMRERATAATPGPWEPGDACVWAQPKGWAVVHDGEHGDGGCQTPEDAAHIAGMHPAVALAVADWLDATANAAEALYDEARINVMHVAYALDVARAYLGGAA